MEFNAQQVLFEVFSHILRIFDSVEPQTESTFPFQYNIIFETYQSLEPPTSTLDGGIHLHPALFCMEFKTERLLFEPFLDIMRIFGSIEP